MASQMTRRLARRLLRRVGLYGLVGLFLAYTLLPVVWMVLSSILVETDFLRLSSDLVLPPQLQFGYYAALLSQHGWIAGRDFTASGTSLHFYGISQLGGGSTDPQLGVYGATDSEAVPYREVLLKGR